MIIDSHTHIGFGKILGSTAKELISSMKNAGIDKSFVFAGEINDCTTEKLINTVSDYPKKIYPIGSVSPLKHSTLSPNALEKLLKEGRIFGLKFYPGYEYFYPSDAALKPWLEILNHYNRPAIFHSGDTYSKVHAAKLKYAHPLHIDDLAVDFPKLKIIIAHVGYPWVTDTAEVCYKNENVFTDISGFVYGSFTQNDEKAIKNVLKTFSTIIPIKEKILFGTDWPISNQTSYVKTLSAILPPTDKDLIFYKNALRVFSIEQ